MDKRVTLSSRSRTNFRSAWDMFVTPFWRTNPLDHEEPSFSMSRRENIQYRLTIALSGFFIFAFYDKFQADDADCLDPSRFWFHLTTWTWMSVIVRYFLSVASMVAYVGTGETRWTLLRSANEICREISLPLSIAVPSGFYFVPSDVDMSTITIANHVMHNWLWVMSISDAYLTRSVLNLYSAIPAFVVMSLYTFAYWMANTMGITPYPGINLLESSSHRTLFVVILFGSPVIVWVASFVDIVVERRTRFWEQSMYLGYIRSMRPLPPSVSERVQIHYEE